MSDDECIDVLCHAAKYKPAALLAYAAILTLKHPEDSPTINAIIVALLK